MAVAVNSPSLLRLPNWPSPSSWSRQAALAGKVDDRIVDTSFPHRKRRPGIDYHRTRSDGLEVIRHSTAHLLAQAVKALYPDAQVTIGPVIEDGFYYDFAYKRGFAEEDLRAIEAKMQEIAKQDLRYHGACCHATRRLPISVAWARSTRPKSSRTFRRANRSHSIARANSRSVPRAACPLHRQAQGLPAHEGCRRLLERRFTQRDAATHLRTAWGDKKTLDAYLASPGGGREARSPQDSARPSPFSICRKRLRAWCSGTSAAGASTRPSSAT